MDQQLIDAIAEDVFGQAAEGYSVPMTNEVAQALGISEEKALSLQDVDEDLINYFTYEAEEA